MALPSLEPCVVYESVACARPGLFEGMALPPILSAAAPKRRVEFLAGRYCAHRALDRLLGTSIDTPVGVGPRGAPVWPPGVVGSITHAHGFAAAAVALADDVAAIGIDSEGILSGPLAREIAPQIATATELEELEHDGHEPATLLTVVFSAKESVFKCLHGIVGRYFDFLDVRAARVQANRFEVELRTDLGRLARGTRFAGRFCVDGGFVHTGITLRPESRRRP